MNDENRDKNNRTSDEIQDPKCDLIITSFGKRRGTHLDISGSLLSDFFAQHARGVELVSFCLSYRTLHSYNLIWAVCHLFPQRWRTLNVQSRETIGQEDHVICLQLRRRAKIQVLRLEPLIRRFFL